MFKMLKEQRDRKLMEKCYPRSIDICPKCKSNNIFFGAREGERICHDCKNVFQEKWIE